MFGGIGRLVLTVVVWVGVLGVCFGEVGKEAGKEELNAEEVLRRFAEARKNMNSFHITLQKHDKCEYSGRLNAKGEMHFRYDNRYDGTRWAQRMEKWGDIAATPIDEDHAMRVFTLWEGEDYYSYYHKPGQGPGRLDMARTSDPGEFPHRYVTSLVQASWPGRVMGYCMGDDLTINELFIDDAARLRLRKSTENIRGADCQVIDAQIRGRGIYTVWIDPARDYHITKMKISRKEGDRYRQNLYRKGEYRTGIYEVVEWQKVGDAWFPRKCVHTLDKFYGGSHYTEESQVEFETVVFHPDHEALGSFLPTDIQDGASVYIYAFPRTKFIWKHGKVLDGEGKEVDIKAQVERQK